MELIDEARDLLEVLMNPPHRDLIELAAVQGVGPDLVLAHIDLMRENGEPVAPVLLALERQFAPQRFPC